MNTVSDTNILKGKQHIHFIGIGGSGMYPLVQILAAAGYHITGSDNNPTDTVDAERKLGISVTIGQKPENIEGADLIVYTAAILPDNPELVAAKASGVPMLERAELLGLLSENYADCIAVSGTHGKTTTTSMITQVLMGAGKDPTAVIGGKLPIIGGSGRAGQSEIMVCEACEFSDHYQHIAPGYAVILNVDADHLDYFGTLENIIASFRRFASKASKAIIANLDDANTMKAVEGLPVRIITFGHTSEADYYPENIRVSEGCTVYDLMSGGRKLTEVVLNIPGVHNVSNSLAAAAACFEQGVTPEEFARELEGFHGAKRRFEIHGENMGITIADDYAHHPRELEVTLQAAKTMHYNEVWAVFQPFTYSRTKMLMDDFARVLPIADHVVMSEIMGSREVNTYGVYTKDLADKIPGSVWFNTFEEITEYVMNHARPGDLVITLGCGDVNKCAKMMMEYHR